MTRILMMGPPESGKGTQAERISDHLDVVVHRQELAQWTGDPLGDHKNWSNLIGQHVQIRKDGTTIRTGLVEAATGETLWVEIQGVEPRALYDKAQGHGAVPVVEPAQDKS